MFSIAFDASGTEHDQPVLVVAGFAAPTRTWTEFDIPWLGRLAKEGLLDFHMADFSKGYDVYSAWKDDTPRRDQLAHDLVDIILSHACRKFGCAVIINDLHAFTTKENRERFYMHAYSVASMASLAQVQRWTLNEHISPPEAIFERGDDKQPEFRKLMISQGEPEPTFRWWGFR